MRAFVRLGEDVVGALDELELDAVAAFIGMLLSVGVTVWVSRSVGVGGATGRAFWSCMIRSARGRAVGWSPGGSDAPW